MRERKLVEALAAEIERATAEGDYDRARKLAELEARVIARISRETVAEGSAQAARPPSPRTEQLARIARHISTEALAAGLAAERRDRESIRETYERLALLFAEYRLTYVRCMGQT